MQRRLTTILAADVVGFSRMIRNDEEGTLRALAVLRADVIDQRIAVHGGRIFKAMGDGILAEFPSVVEAVRASASIQRDLAARNADPSWAPKMELRIGVNLGDVVVEGDDLLGDGVNVASRLEGVSEPGGFCVSASVRDHVRDVAGLAFEDLGPREVKNLDRPVHVWRWVPDGQPGVGLEISTRTVNRSAVRSLGRTWTIASALVLIISAAIFMAVWQTRRDVPTPAPLSITVLPFQNLSEAEDQAYLSEGVTDDLTTELARVPGLFVMSRNASDGYRDSSKTAAEIAQALGVRHVLQGSVQRLDSALRINAQLVDAESGRQLWAKRFDGTFQDVFKMRDQVVAETVDALQVRLVPGKANLAISGDTDNPEAFQALRRAIEVRRKNTPEGTVEALSYLRQALALDPEFGAAAVEMAWLYWDADEPRMQALGIDWDEITTRLAESLEQAARNPSPGYFQLSADLLMREHRSDEAVLLLERAIPLDPSDAWTYESLSQVLSFSGRPGEAMSYLDTAMRVDPGWNDWRRYLAGLAAFGEGRYEDAILVIEEMGKGAPDPWASFYATHVLVAAYAHLNLNAELPQAIEQLRMVTSNTGAGEPDLLNAQRYFVYQHAEDVMRLVDGLRKAGIRELPLRVSTSSRVGDAGRLKNADILDLISNNQLVGRKIYDEEAYQILILKDGRSEIETAGGTFEGHAWVQGDYLCTAYPRFLTTCGVLTQISNSEAEDVVEYRYDGKFSSYSYTTDQ